MPAGRGGKRDIGNVRTREAGPEFAADPAASVENLDVEHARAGAQAVAGGQRDLVIPGRVGVPLMTPVVALSVSPGGQRPAAGAQGQTSPPCRRSCWR